MNRTIAYRVLSDKRTYLFVSELPGQGGVDWGYTSERADAKPLTAQQAKRFRNDMEYVGDIGMVSPVPHPER